MSRAVTPPIWIPLSFKGKKKNHLKHCQKAISEKVPCHPGPISLLGVVYATCRYITSDISSEETVKCDSALFFWGQNIKQWISHVGVLPSNQRARALSCRFAPKYDKHKERKPLWKRQRHHFLLWQYTICHQRSWPQLCVFHLHTVIFFLGAFQRHPGKQSKCLINKA